MGTTRENNIFRIRDLLDNPLPNAPSFHTIFRQCISEEQDIVNQLNNTGIAWGVKEYQLNYTPSIDTYQINVEDWGKVMLVVKETGNPYVPYVPVPFTDLAEQRYGTILSAFYGVYGTLFPASETIERMAFYREGTTDAQYMVKINPRPNMSWTYLITYMPGYMGTDDPLETATQMPEHVDLLRLRAAMALLGYSKWSDDEAFNRQKRLELADSPYGFKYQLVRKEQLFSRYIQSINIPRTVEVDNWT
jgi:hypothetical protein